MRRRRAVSIAPQRMRFFLWIAGAGVLVLLLRPGGIGAMPLDVDIEVSDGAVDQQALRAMMPGLAGFPRRIRRSPEQALDPARDLLNATSISGDTWIELPPPVRYNAVGMYDSATDRFMVCGGKERGPIDVWALDLARPEQWVQLAAGGERPRHQRIAATAIDSDRRRIFFIDVGTSEKIGEISALDLTGSPAWTRIGQSTSRPPGRQYATAIYDPRRDRLLIFGGYGYQNPLRDVWSLDLATGVWTTVQAGGDSIASRYLAQSIYDPDHDRMLVYGGVVELEPRVLAGTDELWALQFGDSTTWRHVIASGDSTDNRYGAALVRDPIDGSILLLGGADSEGPAAPGDVFRFTESPAPTWSRVVPARSPSRVRTRGATAYDPRRNQFMIFGGHTHLDQLDVDILSMRPTPNWTALSRDSLPSERFGQAMAMDSKRDRLVIFGGVSSAGYLGDVWAAPLSSPENWLPLATAGAAPPPRHEPVMVYDPLRDRMVAFAGWTYPDHYFDDTWLLALDHEPTWVQVEPEGGPPPGRRAHAAVYDPLRDRMLVFFGYGGSGELDDIWALNLAEPMRWERLEPAGPSPRARGFVSAVYDPTRDRVVVYGGLSDSQSLGDSWALVLKDLHWELLVDGSRVPDLARHTAVYDLNNDRMVVFGGFGADYDVLSHVEGVTFILKFRPDPQWSVDRFDDFASTRSGHTAAFDAHRSRMAIFGGGRLVDYANDSWLLDFGAGRRDAWLIASSTTDRTASLVWQAGTNAPSSARVERSSIGEPWRPVGDAVVSSNGRFSFHDLGLSPGWPYQYRLSGSTGALTAETRITTDGAPKLRMFGAWPNPAKASALTIQFALGSASPAIVEIFDLGGRRLWTDRLSPRSAGVSSLQAPGSWRPGIYVVRLTQDGQLVTGKVCVLR